MRRRSFLASAAVMPAVALGGCSTLPWVRDNELVARAAVRQATLRAIDEDPQRAARAQEIIAAAQDHIAQDLATSVAQVADAIRAEIRWASLSTADAELIALVIDAIELRLQERIGDGELDEEALVTVQAVLQWAHSAAAMVAG